MKQTSFCGCASFACSHCYIKCSMLCFFAFSILYGPCSEAKPAHKAWNISWCNADNQDNSEHFMKQHEKQRMDHFMKQTWCFGVALFFRFPSCNVPHIFGT